MLHFSNRSGAYLILLLLIILLKYFFFQDEIKSGLSEFEKSIVVSQLCIPDTVCQPCGAACVSQPGIVESHQSTLLGRGFCCPSPASVVYITNKHSQNMINFALTLRGLFYACILPCMHVVSCQYNFIHHSHMQSYIG